MSAKRSDIIKWTLKESGTTEKLGDIRLTRYLLLDLWPCGMRKGKVILSGGIM